MTIFFPSLFLLIRVDWIIKKWKRSASKVSKIDKTNVHFITSRCIAKVLKVIFWSCAHVKSGFQIPTEKWFPKKRYIFCSNYINRSSEEKIFELCPICLSRQNDFCRGQNQNCHRQNIFCPEQKILYMDKKFIISDEL